ncbi:translation initiation factor IF-2-like [Vigna umbellata]|uniref:translation initiation factor IF-2-like n=1 Tax=Vigna umbellata TaxID=87088 RepID=UPI001F5F0456|nr:translation initiation factor IF-2-like [Vigna umbellata]
MTVFPPPSSPLLQSHQFPGFLPAAAPCARSHVGVVPSVVFFLSRIPLVARLLPIPNFPFRHHLCPPFAPRSDFLHSCHFLPSLILSLLSSVPVLPFPSFAAVPLCSSTFLSHSCSLFFSPVLVCSVLTSHSTLILPRPSLSSPPSSRLDTFSLPALRSGRFLLSSRRAPDPCCFALTLLGYCRPLSCLFRTPLLLSLMLSPPSLPVFFWLPTLSSPSRPPVSLLPASQGPSSRPSRAPNPARDPLRIFSHPGVLPWSSVPSSIRGTRSLLPVFALPPFCWIVIARPALAPRWRVAVRSSPRDPLSAPAPVPAYSRSASRPIPLRASLPLFLAAPHRPAARLLPAGAAQGHSPPSLTLCLARGARASALPVRGPSLARLIAQEPAPRPAHAAGRGRARTEDARRPHRAGRRRAGRLCRSAQPTARGQPTATAAAREPARAISLLPPRPASCGPWAAALSPPPRPLPRRFLGLHARWGQGQPPRGACAARALRAAHPGRPASSGCCASPGSAIVALLSYRRRVRSPPTRPWPRGPPLRPARAHVASPPLPPTLPEARPAPSGGRCPAPRLRSRAARGAPDIPILCPHPRPRRGHSGHRRCRQTSPRVDRAARQPACHAAAGRPGAPPKPRGPSTIAAQRGRVRRGSAPAARSKASLQPGRTPHRARPVAWPAPRGRAAPAPGGLTATHAGAGQRGASRSADSPPAAAARRVDHGGHRPERPARD